MTFQFAGLAQSVEQLLCKRLVGGSYPSPGTMGRRAVPTTETKTVREVGPFTALQGSWSQVQQRPDAYGPRWWKAIIELATNAPSIANERT